MPGKIKKYLVLKVDFNCKLMFCNINIYFTNLYSTGLDISSVAIAWNSFQICPTVKAIVDEDENILGIFCHVPKYAQKQNDSPWLNFELRTRQWPAGQMLIVELLKMLSS